MVPAASEDKVDACMTYLNWLADPTNAENVAYTPEHEVSENGVPVGFTADELSTMGYKGTLDDYNIVNKHFAFMDDEAGEVLYENTGTSRYFMKSFSKAMGKDPIDSKEWYENFYETVAIGKYRYPVFSINAEAENEYGTQIRSDLIEYVYRLISCKPDEFDSLEAQLKSDMDNAGLTDIIEGRAALYDEEMAAAE